MSVMGKKAKVEDPLRKVVDDLIKSVQKKYGFTSIARANEINLPTGRRESDLLSFDYVTCGGIPKGCPIQIKGPDFAGKTTVALKVAASVIQDGGRVVWINSEGNMDRDWTRQVGIPLPPGPGEEEQYDKIMEVTGGEVLNDPSQFILVEGADGESSFQIGFDFLVRGAVDLMVIDSIAALTPKGLLDKNFDETSMRAAKAGLNTRFIEKVYHALGQFFDPETKQPSRKKDAVKNQCSIIVINQFRDVGIGKKFGANKGPDSTGGWALRHMKRADIEVKSKDYTIPDKRKGAKKYAKIVLGKEITLHCKASQIGEPGRVASFRLYTKNVGDFFAGDVDDIKEVIDLCVAFEIIEVSASYYTFGDEKIHGKPALKEHLSSHPEQLDDLIEELRDAF